MPVSIVNSARIAVIGGGISGLAVSQMLRQRGFTPTIFESNDRIGGLVSCTQDEGHLFHRVGGHVFNSKNEKVLQWFWSFFEKNTEFRKAKRNAVIFMDGEFIPYPIERSLGLLPSNTARDIVNELLQLHSQIPDSLKVKGNVSGLSFGDFLLSNFGSTLCDKYFFPYNKKIWNRDLFTIPLPWLEGKLPMATPAQIIQDNILRTAEAEMVHSSFYYPQDGGSQFIANRLSDGIEIVFDKVFRISVENQKFMINDHPLPYDRVVFTADVRALPGILAGDSLSSLKSTIAQAYSDIELDSNGTSNLLCECDANDYSWIYLPSDNTKFHRIIMTGNFSPNNNSETILPGRISCTVESSGFHSREDLDEELCMLPFALKSVAYNYCANSYIIHNALTSSLLRKIKSACSHQGIYLCGRFAEWEYYNMDAAIESAMAVTDKLCSSL